MKKVFILIILFLIMVIGVPVFAAQYHKNDLIAASETATVDTDSFTYTDFTYSPTVPGKKFGRFSFKSITNKGEKSAPVSVDILLFNSEKKNIGFVTYCTDEDPSGDYSHFKLGAGKTTAFYINVADRYFVGDAGPADVAYYAVLDDNPYCHVGGYDKYAGLTIEQISSGSVVMKDSEGNSFTFNQDIFNFVNNAAFILVVIYIVGGLAALIIQGLILNALNKRMFATTTSLAYIPIANSYLAVKLAFGSSIAKIYIIAFFVCIPLSLIKIFVIISLLISFIGFIAFIIDIIKLITKKYDLCYFEPFQNNTNVAVGGGFKLDSRAKEETVYTDTPVADANNSSLLEEEEKIDLSYSDSDTNNSSLNSEEKVDLGYDNNIPTDGFMDSQNIDSNQSGFDMSDFSNFSDNSLPDSESKGENKDKKEGESDLVNLFK